MSHTHQYLTFYINLTDKAVVTALQATGSADTVGATLDAPDAVALTHSAPLLGKRAPFVAPSITSEWITGPTGDPSNIFPTNVAAFDRKSGGWFGIPALFGDTITYHWRGLWTYVPPVVPDGVVGAPANLMTRRWIDGFEVYFVGSTTIGPEGGLNGLQNQAGGALSRVASRHVGGMGFAWRALANGNTRSHDVRENGGALRPGAGSWERIYVRLRTAPAAQTRILTWQHSAGLDGYALEVMPSGQLAIGTLNAAGTFTQIGATTALPIGGWTRLDVVLWFGSLPAGATQCTIWLDGVVAIAFGFNPGPGPSLPQGVGSGAFAHATSKLGAIAANTLAMDFDDWIAGEFAGRTDGVDFQNGSRVAWISATGFDAATANFAGDWRNVLSPVVADQDTSLLTSAVNGAIAAVTTDAADTIDACPESLGVAALHLGAWCQVGNNLATSLSATGPAAIGFTAGSVVVADWKVAFKAITGTPTPLTPIAPLSLLFRKDAAGATTLAHLSATAELVGSFGPEDVTLATPRATPLPANTGPHNAPYPRTPWARLTVAPVQPVFVRSGSYVGTGTFLDLTFPAPVHFLWIRPLTVAAGGVHWWSTLLGSHVGVVNGIKANLMAQALMDAGFVPSTVETDAQMVDRRIWEAFAQTEGEPPSEADYVYWRGVIAADPGAIVAGVLIDYWWQKLLGQDATGVDLPTHGPYAVPPSALLPLAAGISTIGGANAQQQARLRIVGNQNQNNAVGVVYQYLAIGDPGQRFMVNTGITDNTGATDKTTALVHPTFTPQALFSYFEASGGINSALYYKGPGHAAASISPLHQLELANALTLGLASVVTKAAYTAISQGPCTPISCWRTDDGSSVAGVSNKGKVVQITSYVGNGTATRTLLLTPAVGLRPLFALVVPHNAVSYFRDAAHTGTTSSLATTKVVQAGGITAGDVDAITVDLTLNANGIVYDVWAVPGSTVAGNSGFSVAGDFWPVPPEPPPSALTALTGPEPGDPPVADEAPPVSSADPLPPSGPLPGLTDDLAAACTADTHRIVNLALSRIGTNKQIAALATEATREAVVVRLVYNEAIQQTLRDFPWPFATRYVRLAVLNSGARPNTDFRYAYRQPNDCVFERRIVVSRTDVANPDGVPFQLSSDFDPGDAVAIPAVPASGGGIIFTNLANAVLEYTARPKCPHTKSDPLFRDAVAWKLAEALAPSLSRMTDAALTCAKAYQGAIEQAYLVLRPGNAGDVPATATIDTTAAAQAANLSVANAALIQIGARTIRNLTSDQSREAQLVRIVFEQELRATLRDYPWPFATVYSTPTLVGGTSSVGVNGDWQYSYRLPTDLVFARRLVTLRRRAYEPNPSTFKLANDATGGLLYSDVESTTAAPMVLEYTNRPEGAVLVADALFRDALAWRLAWKLAPSLALVIPERPEAVGRGPDETANQTKERTATGASLRARAAATARECYYFALATAKVSAAREAQPDTEPPDASWISDRD